MPLDTDPAAPEPSDPAPDASSSPDDGADVPRRRLRKRTSAYVILTLTALVMAAMVTYGNMRRAELLANTERVAEAYIEETAEAFQDVDPITQAEINELRTFKNKEHVAKAEELGIAGITDRDVAEELVEAGELVELESNQFYYVEPMDYGIPYVTPATAAMLQRLGERFHATLAEHNLPPYRFHITSATRTASDQKRLARVNSNAVPKSSHSYGTTVDVHYGRFGYAQKADSLPPTDEVLRDELGERLTGAYTALGVEHVSKLKALLGRALGEGQGIREALVIHERRQPVYHVTIAAEIPESAGAQAQK